MPTYVWTMGLFEIKFFLLAILKLIKILNFNVLMFSVWSNSYETSNFQLVFFSCTETKIIKLKGAKFTELGGLKFYKIKPWCETEEN